MINKEQQAISPKEYLKQAYYIDRKIGIDLSKLEAMRSSLFGRSVSYDTTVAANTSGRNNVENAIHKVLEYEDRINKEIDRLVDMRLEIERTIAAVSDPLLCELLTRRYLCFEKWEVIAVNMNRDLRWIYRLHGRALSEVEKILQKETPHS